MARSWWSRTGGRRHGRTGGGGRSRKGTAERAPPSAPGPSCSAAVCPASTTTTDCPSRPHLRACTQPSVSLATVVVMVGSFCCAVICALWHALTCSCMLWYRPSVQSAALCLCVYSCCRCDLLPARSADVATCRVVLLHPLWPLSRQRQTIPAEGFSNSAGDCSTTLR